MKAIYLIFPSHSLWNEIALNVTLPYCEHICNVEDKLGFVWFFNSKISFLNTQKGIHSLKFNVLEEYSNFKVEICKVSKNLS